MKFRTEINIKDAPHNLSPERLVIMAGSCFSDNIGAKMRSSGWPVCVNPCGVIYNPVSMGVLFQLALTHRSVRREIISAGLTRREGKYVSWLMSSVAQGSTPEECVDSVCERIDILEENLEKADAMVLTFGTSDVWLLASTDRAVGNCHKHPSSEFEKRRCDVGEIVALWKGIIRAVRERNPELKVIFTVSPRRYLSDGFAENTRQKAVLILSCERLCRELENTVYFPAYEIMNDDLRDYRFYASDLLHPSEQAVEYIWEKFVEAFLDEEERKKLAEMEKENKRLSHRPIIN